MTDGIENLDWTEALAVYEVNGVDPAKVSAIKDHLSQVLTLIGKLDIPDGPNRKRIADRFDYLYGAIHSEISDLAIVADDLLEE